MQEPVADAANVVFIGAAAWAKMMRACNLAYQAKLACHTALFSTAGHMLGDLGGALHNDSTLRRRLRHYAAPDLLVIDESATCRNPTATPIYSCSNWSVAAISRLQQFHLRTGA